MPSTRSMAPNAHAEVSISKRMQSKNLVPNSLLEAVSIITKSVESMQHDTEKIRCDKASQDKTKQNNTRINKTGTDQTRPDQYEPTSMNVYALRRKLQGCKQVRTIRTSL